MWKKREPQSRRTAKRNINITKAIMVVIEMMINPRLQLFLLLVLLWMSGLFITMAAGRLLIAAASYLFLNDFDFKWSDLITALKISVGAGFIIGGGQSLQVKEKK
jgi:uncharacterized membrane protein YvlD (DUF360 family)